MRYVSFFVQQKLHTLPFKIGYTVLLSLITLCHLFNYRTLMSHKIYIAVILDNLYSTNQLLFTPWEIENKAGTLFCNSEDKGRSRPSRITERSYANYKWILDYSSERFKMNLFSLLTTKVPVQENTGVMLQALSHSIRNFTVQKIYISSYKCTKHFF